MLVKNYLLSLMFDISSSNMAVTTIHEASIAVNRKWAFYRIVAVVSNCHVVHFIVKCHLILLENKYDGKGRLSLFTWHLAFAFREG